MTLIVEGRATRLLDRAFLSRGRRREPDIGGRSAEDVGGWRRCMPESSRDFQVPTPCRYGRFVCASHLALAWTATRAWLPAWILSTGLHFRSVFHLIWHGFP
jgi:hypothetical protein